MKKNSRRNFLKSAGVAGLGIAGTKWSDLFAASTDPVPADNFFLFSGNYPAMIPPAENLSIIGLYGPWAYSLTENRIPSFSF